jgi:hypothetical protein
VNRCRCSECSKRNSGDAVVDSFEFSAWKYKVNTLVGM